MRSRSADAFVLSFAVLVALGLARFSYALVLPSMRSDLQLSYGAAGSLGTANTAGYLVGLLALPFAVARFSTVSVFRFSVAVTAAALFLTGASHAYPVVLLGRFSAGCAGAGAFILGSAIAASLSLESKLGSKGADGPAGARGSDAVVVYNAGGGVGVVIAGLILPSLLDGRPDRWPVAWFVLGAVAVVATLALAVTPWTAPSTSPSRISVSTALRGRPTLHWLTASYACFGAGYIVYVTFLISTLRSGGASKVLMTTAFVLMGVMAIVGPKLWRVPISSWPTRRLMAATMTAQAIGGGLLLISRSPAFVIVSVLVFGSAFLLTPAVVPMTVRQVRAPHEWASTIGALTASFAFAQAVSPWISGVLIDHLGVASGPAWTLGFSSLGAVIALTVKR